MPKVNLITKSNNLYEMPAPVPTPVTEESKPSELKSAKLNLNTLPNSNRAYHPSFSGNLRTSKELLEVVSPAVRAEIAKMEKSVKVLVFSFIPAKNKEKISLVVDDIVPFVASIPPIESPKGSIVANILFDHNAQGNFLPNGIKSVNVPFDLKLTFQNVESLEDVVRKGFNNIFLKLSLPAILNRHLSMQTSLAQSAILGTPVRQLAKKYPAAVSSPTKYIPLELTYSVGEHNHLNKINQRYMALANKAIAAS